jgi:phosphoglycolate phosphatase-like HAD superfamily hydrolase
VTGNLCRIGWKKLERAGLDHYFEFGVFGEMAATRVELTRLAVAHARARGWGGNDGGRGFLIGDTPTDVEAGRANGLETIAVATGVNTLDELRASGATLVAPDLTHPEVIQLLQSRR